MLRERRVSGVELLCPVSQADWRGGEDRSLVEDDGVRGGAAVFMGADGEDDGEREDERDHGCREQFYWLHIVSVYFGFELNCCRLAAVLSDGL